MLFDINFYGRDMGLALHQVSMSPSVFADGLLAEWDAVTTLRWIREELLSHRELDDVEAILYRFADLDGPGMLTLSRQDWSLLAGSRESGTAIFRALSNIIRAQQVRYIANDCSTFYYNCQGFSQPTQLDIKNLCLDGSYYEALCGDYTTMRNVAPLTNTQFQPEKEPKLDFTTLDAQLSQPQPLQHSLPAMPLLQLQPQLHPPQQPHMPKQQQAHHPQQLHLQGQQHLQQQLQLQGQLQPQQQLDLEGQLTLDQLPQPLLQLQPNLQESLDWPMLDQATTESCSETLSAELSVSEEQAPLSPLLAPENPADAADAEGPPSPAPAAAATRVRRGGRPPRPSSERVPRKRRGAGEAPKGRLWQFILKLLRKNSGELVRWVDEKEGVFYFVRPKVVAKMWGTHKGNEKMTFEKMSRSMRHYENGYFESWPGRLYYKFGRQADWRREQVQAGRAGRAQGG